MTTVALTFAWYIHKFSPITGAPPHGRYDFKVTIISQKEIVDSKSITE